MELSFGNILQLEDFGEYPPRLDYSNHNVIFEFKVDSVLTVSGDMYHSVMDLYAERGWEDYFSRMIWEGTYSYTIEMLGESYSKPECYITIDDDVTYNFHIYENASSTSMSIGLTGWGGFSLVKIEE